mgnify:CR=1 FL=1
MADSTSSTNWLKVLAAAYSAFQNQKEKQSIAKQMSAPQIQSVTSTKTPYMNPQIQAILPYIMNEAQRIYQSREKFAGGTPANFSPFQTQLNAMKPEDWLKGQGIGGINTDQAAGSYGSGGSIGGSATGIGSGAGSDFNVRGAALDPLTEEQHRAGAYEVSMDDLKKLGSGLAGLVPSIATGGLAGLAGTAATPLIDKLWAAVKDKLFGGDPSTTDKYSGMYTSPDIVNALTGKQGDFSLQNNKTSVDKPAPTLKDRFTVAPGISNAYIYRGTASPYDWGDGTGGGGGGGLGGSIWDIPLY